MLRGASTAAVAALQGACLLARGGAPNDADGAAGLKRDGCARSRVAEKHVTVFILVAPNVGSVSVCGRRVCGSQSSSVAPFKIASATLVTCCTAHPDPRYLPER